MDGSLYVAAGSVMAVAWILNRFLNMPPPTWRREVPAIPAGLTGTLRAQQSFPRGAKLFYKPGAWEFQVDGLNALTQTWGQF